MPASGSSASGRELDNVIFREELLWMIIPDPIASLEALESPAHSRLLALSSPSTRKDMHKNIHKNNSSQH
jgi:hypothetical protein